MSETPRSSNPAIWVGVALVLSLAVNTFFVGLMVGGRLTADRLGGGVPDIHNDHAMPPDLDPRAMARMLPESARDDAEALMMDRGPEIRGLFEDAIAARGAALDAMRAEPFDPETLADAFATSREADAAARAAVHALTVDIVAGMSPEERQQIGMDLHERFPFRHDRHDRFGPRRDRDDRPHFERRFDRDFDGEGPPPPPPGEDGPEDD